jgi:DNA-binding MarR family transcriptional regulator
MKNNPHQSGAPAKAAARARASGAAVVPPPARFIDDYLSYLLALASYAVYRDFGREVKEAGLSSLEWRVLASLSDGAGMTVGQLAREVVAKQPTLTKLVNRMAAAGLVRRGDDDADARRTLVFATPAGRAKIAHLLVAAKRHEAALLARYSAREAAAFKDMLRALARGSDRRPGT